MADLGGGRTRQESYRWQQDSPIVTSKTFTWNFQPDHVVVRNLDAWLDADRAYEWHWFREETAAAHAMQISEAGTVSELTSAGFTVADTSGGQEDLSASIDDAGVTAAQPPVVTTSAVHGFQSDQIVRFTDLGPMQAPVADRGMDELNGNRYRITVLSTTSFSLQNVDNDEDVDGSGYVAHVAGGKVKVESLVLALNHPQVSPYDSTPYVSNPFEYKAIEYKLTAGATVVGTSVSDPFVIVATQFGLYENLGIG